MRSIVLAAALLAGGLSMMTAACDEGAPTVPASADPQGKDLVKGAIVAAAESSGGIRLYKIVHVDDYPPPIGYELHMIAYDPKVQSYEEAAKLWKKKEGLSVVLDHVHVQLVQFLMRDRRVLAVEPVSDDELKPYLRSKRQ